MSLSQLYPNIRPALLLDFAKTQALDPRITFTRSTTAVYYDGITDTVAEQNLILWSQEFQQSAWGASTLGTTVTTNTAVAPDGTTTADTLSFVATAYRYNSCTAGTLTGRTFTFSCWVWTATAKSAIGIRISGNTTGSDNTVLSQALTGTATRVSVTRTFTSTDTVIICGFDNRVAQGGDGIAGDVIVWGAQLEERSTATAYTPTTTTAIITYQPVLLTAGAGQARFDHDPVTGTSLGLLIEDQRTNQLLWSEMFSDAIWTNNQLTIDPIAAIAPDGTQTANKITATTGSLGHFIYQDSTTVVSTVYTQTVYAKAGEYSVLQITSSTGFAGSGVAYQNYNLSTGALGASVAGNTGGTSTITAVGNGWYRCSFTSTAVSTTARFVIAISSTDGAGRLPTFTGDGYSGIYIWGAQLEAGAFPTTYIATTVSTQTRSRDTAYLPTAGWLSDSGQATVFVELNSLNFSTGTNTQFFGLFANTALTNGQDKGLTLYNSYNFLTRLPTANTLPILGWQSGISKLAIAIDSAGKYGCKNGSTVATTVIANANDMSEGVVFSLIGAAASNACSQIKKIAYYPERVTDVQLQALTQS